MIRIRGEGEIRRPSDEGKETRAEKPVVVNGLKGRQEGGLDFSGLL